MEESGLYSKLLKIAEIQTQITYLEYHYQC